MTENPKGLQRSRSTDHQFLFCKTDPKTGQDTDNLRQPEVPDILAGTYPDMLCGTAFLEQAMDRVSEIPVFSAMVIRIDRPETDGDSPLSEFSATVAGTIERICQPADGLWGWIAEDTFGAIFPGTGTPDGNGFAERVLEHLRQASDPPGSVTVGIANFPTIDYPKNRILDNARKAVDHAAFFGPGSVVSFDSVSLNISGDRCYQEGDIRGAIAEFEKALEIDASNVNVHNSLGVCYGVLGDFEKASEAFEAAVRLDPDEAMAVFNLGRIHQLSGEDREKAMACFLEADRLGGDIFEVALQIGRLYLEMEAPRRAEAFLQKAARIRPESSLSHRCLGECREMMGEDAKAAAAYRQAIKRNPNDAEALSALGSLMDRLGENPEVTVAFCRHSVEIAPENGLFWYRLGRIYSRRQRLRKALSALEKAQELGHDATAEIDAVREKRKAAADNDIESPAPETGDPDLSSLN